MSDYGFPAMGKNFLTSPGYLLSTPEAAGRACYKNTERAIGPWATIPGIFCGAGGTIAGLGIALGSFTVIPWAPLPEGMARLNGTSIQDVHDGMLKSAR